ncbi:MAG: alkaline phosphatase family protein [Spirochaetales bacterium]|nr:alkaline phosphatase family protein [Spirochaetales bacterium]
MKNSFVFLFIDGIGLGPKNQYNPFYANTMSFLENLIQGKTVEGHFFSNKKTLFRGIDAKLDTQGLPQSATGQTALFTGVNAPKLIGYHYPAFPNPPLRSILEQENIFKKVLELGGTATFANAYGSQYFKMVEEGKRHHSATTWSVLYSGLPFRGVKELKQGRAVYWDFTNENFINSRDEGIDIISAKEAGIRLSRISSEYNFLLFESFLTDMIGHKQDHQGAERFCRLFDDFLNALISGLSDNQTLIVSSDHGNFEDLSVPSHTYNDAWLLVHGPQAPAFETVDTIINVTDRIIECLRKS